MIAIKDAKGSVLARSMLRLLWDASSQKPVVFLDRIYPYSLPSLLEKAIQAYAKEKAFALGLELVSCDLKGMLPYQGRVCSLASSSPYEYADGGEGVTLGVFQIFNPCYVVPSFS